MSTSTLDGMTVAQLDDLIARATATKQAAEQREAADKRWIFFRPEYTEYRVHADTFVVQSKNLGQWVESSLFSRDMQEVKAMGTRKKYLQSALNALGPFD
jgi:hypothetical protein